MPELPEVETVRRGLAARLTGRRIARVTVRRADLRRPLPPDLAEALAGRAVQGFARRGKYLLVHLEGGGVLIAHLGMSGRFCIADRPSGDAHEHVVFHFDDGAVLSYDGPPALRPDGPRRGRAARGACAAAPHGA